MKDSPQIFHYVYILQFIPHSTHFYTGFNQDLHSRLKSHNHGQVPPTADHKPWRIKTAIAFTDPEKARDFEAYLKTSSGRAFAKKRL